MPRGKQPTRRSPQTTLPADVASASPAATKKIVLACISQPADHAAITAAVRSAHVELCRDLSRLMEPAIWPALAGIMLDDQSGNLASDVAQAVTARKHFSNDLVPLLIRCALSQTSIRIVLDHWDDLGNARLSFRNVDTFATCVSAFFAGSNPTSARMAILSRIQHIVASTEPQLLVAAVVLGERARTVSELATVCGLSTRRIEERMAEAGLLLSPKPLLARILTLHSLWQVEQLGWNQKRAATTAGIRSSTALGKRVKRAAGSTLATLRESSAFAFELDRLARDLTAAHRA